MNDDEFVNLLHKIRDDILREVEELQRIPEVRGGEAEDGATQVIQQCGETEPRNVSMISRQDEDNNKEGLSPHGSQGGDEEQTEELNLNGRDSSNLTVNCFCYLGRHRSASMVEELARVKWPSGIHIVVIHRDIDKDRRKPGKNKRIGKKSRMLGSEDDL
ncbi:hypothetical protein ABW19_dt0207663 [Dactylella cylindrospora]|nr:hypothetical protein ABW19_dt0207663 [Dactylella cylindrospora]